MDGEWAKTRRAGASEHGLWDGVACFDGEQNEPAMLLVKPNERKCKKEIPVTV